MIGDHKDALLSVVLLGAATLIQSTLLGAVAVKGVIPDIALIALVFVSVRRGSMAGQIVGFVAGLAEDLVGLSPLGFHALNRTVVGFLSGLFYGSIFVDPIFMPAILVLSATLIQRLISAIVLTVFNVEPIGAVPHLRTMGIELVYNVVLTPFLFAALNGLPGFLKPREKRKAP